MSTHAPAVYSATRQGLSHTVNEDGFAVGDDYIVVADGMGGESDGDVASRLAIATITGCLNRLSASADGPEIVRQSVDAIMEADAAIGSYIDANPTSVGMGTTALIVVWRGDALYATWCGDSRCYIYGDDGLRSLTKDHSYVQELIDRGEISVDDSFTHPDSNLITRYVGGCDGTCVPESVECTLGDADLLLACSDGLSGYCRTAAIEEVVRATPDLRQLPPLLLELALKHGSDDDITVVAASRTPRRPAAASGLRSSFIKWLGRISHSEPDAEP